MLASHDRRVGDGQAGGSAEALQRGGGLAVLDGELRGVAGGDGGDRMLVDLVGVVGGLGVVGAGGHDVAEILGGEAAG